MPSTETPTADAAADGDDPSVVVRRSQSEFRLLETGEFSDFTFACGDREWKVHKAILSKVPYFNAIVGGGFKVHIHSISLNQGSDVAKANAAIILQEAIQEKITIKEFFEPFEIQWLLAYIYFPCFDPETARLDTASKSYLETCVRLWHLGDYFQVESMKKLAKQKLTAGCDRWRQCSGEVDKVKHGTTFIIDVESAIRQAWREDLLSGPLRAMLTKLCIEFAAYIRRHQSFYTLLQEVPQFAVAFSKLALGSVVSSRRLPKPDRVVEPNAPSSTDHRSSALLRSLESISEGHPMPSGLQRALQRAGSSATARRVRSRTSIAHISRMRSGEASDQVAVAQPEIIAAEFETESDVDGRHRGVEDGGSTATKQDK